MSTDTYRIDQASGFFHMLWTAPISIPIALALLIVNLGPSALAGFGLFFISGPIILVVIKSLFRFRVDVDKITDQRVSLTQEILQAIRFIKVFGWESSFLNRLAAVRNREIKGIQVLLSVRNGIYAIGISMPIFASILAFLCYSFTSHNLDPGDVFSSLAFFNVLRMPLQILPLIVGQVADAFSSMDRIQEFLTAEDQRGDAVWDPESTDAVTVNQADFAWKRVTAQDSDEAILTKLSDKWAAKGQWKAAKEAKQAAKTEARRMAKEGKYPTAANGHSTETLDEVQPFQLRGINLTVGRTEFIAVIGQCGLW